MKVFFSSLFLLATFSFSAIGAETFPSMTGEIHNYDSKLGLKMHAVYKCTWGVFSPKSCGDKTIEILLSQTGTFEIPEMKFNPRFAINPVEVNTRTERLDFFLISPDKNYETLIAGDSDGKFNTIALQLKENTLLSFPSLKMKFVSNDMSEKDFDCQDGVNPRLQKCPWNASVRFVYEFSDRGPVEITYQTLPIEGNLAEISPGLQLVSGRFSLSDARLKLIYKRDFRSSDSAGASESVVNTFESNSGDIKNLWKEFQVINVPLPFRD